MRWMDGAGGRGGGELELFEEADGRLQVLEFDRAPPHFGIERCGRQPNV